MIAAGILLASACARMVVASPAGELMMTGVVLALLLVGSLGVVAVMVRRSTLGGDPRRDMARSMVRDVRNERDLVKIVGTVHLADAPLHAPLSGIPCAAWEVVVEENDDGTWNTVVTERQGADFYVRDDSGRAFVKVVDYATFYLRQEKRFHSGFFRSATDSTKAFLARHGQDTMSGLPRNLRSRERVVCAGAQISVSGLAHFDVESDPEPGTELSYREPPKRLILLGDHTTQLHLSDRI